MLFNDRLEKDFVPARDAHGGSSASTLDPQEWPAQRWIGEELPAVGQLHGRTRTVSALYASLERLLNLCIGKLASFNDLIDPTPFILLAHASFP